MGWRLMGEVLDHYHGPHVKKLWLLAFAHAASDQTRQGWPGRALLARRADVSPARVSNLATELAGDGVIKRVGGGGRHRGEARYELLPLGADGECQGSPIPNPDEAVDNSPQGSARANPRHEVKGSARTNPENSQGSESGSQGSAISPLPAETPYNSQNSQEPYVAPDARLAADPYLMLPRFGEFWDAYPRHVGKRRAATVYRAALNRCGDPQLIISGAKRYADERHGQDPKFTKHPATWLNGDCWADEPALAGAVADREDDSWLR